MKGERKIKNKKLIIIGAIILAVVLIVLVMDLTSDPDAGHVIFKIKNGDKITKVNDDEIASDYENNAEKAKDKYSSEKDVTVTGEIETIDPIEDGTLWIGNYYYDVETTNITLTSDYYEVDLYVICSDGFGEVPKKASKLIKSLNAGDKITCKGSFDDIDDSSVTIRTSYDQIKKVKE